MSEEEFCKKCSGYNYELLGCCSGRQCGCMGMPVDTKPCSECNPDGKKEPSEQAKEDWPYFFLSEQEWTEYQEENKPKL